MKYVMFCSSPTGNTRMLADAAEQVLAGETKVENPEEADLVCAGFWTDQGTADEKSRKFLKSLKGRKVFLFGTAGFGDSQTYFDGVLEAAEDNLSETNAVIGKFMCQGKMPQAVRDRYNRLKEEVPSQGAHYDLMISNFDKALSHPDETDLEKMKEALREALKAL
jgi:flavodoxin I